MRPEDKLKFKRPTTAVRVRPYLFLYQDSFFTLGLGGVVPPLYFRPQGNVADGNRVTWGWWIRVLCKNLTGTKILFNGKNIDIPAGVYEFTLVDTTKNSAGIDTTEYTLQRLGGDACDILALEQILQVSEL